MHKKARSAAIGIQAHRYSKYSDIREPEGTFAPETVLIQTVLIPDCCNVAVQDNAIKHGESKRFFRGTSYAIVGANHWNSH
jgi:hypothetical protein